MIMEDIDVVKRRKIDVSATDDDDDDADPQDVVVVALDNRNDDGATTPSSSLSSFLDDRDILGKVLEYSDLSTVAAVTRVSKSFQACLETVREGIYGNIVRADHPRLVELMEFVRPEDRSYEILLRRELDTSFTPFRLNRRLQKDLEIVFRHEGIVAFANCCCANCHAYKTDDFTERIEGIYFIHCRLNGSFYEADLTRLSCLYHSHHHLMEYWDEECDILHRWCGVLGLRPGDYDIIQPSSHHRVIVVEFKEPLQLEAVDYSSGDDDEDDEGVDSDSDSGGVASDDEDDSSAPSDEDDIEGDTQIGRVNIRSSRTFELVYLH